MIMSQEQIDAALKGEDVDEIGNQFGLVKSSWRKWPNGEVPYVLSDSVSMYSKKFESNETLDSLNLNVVPELTVIQSSIVL